MLFYDIRLRCTVAVDAKEQEVEELPFCDGDDEEEEKQLQNLNAAIYNNQSEDDEFYAVVYKRDEKYLDIAVAVRPEKVSKNEIKQRLINALSDFAKTKDIAVEDLTEITAKKFLMLTDEAHNKSYIKRPQRRNAYDLGLNYYGSNYFKINEIIAPIDVMDREAAMSTAKSLMADKSLIDEVERIYAPENIRKFYGFPVHYKLQVGTRDAALPIVTFIMQMLYCNMRIPGSRINYISDITEACFDEEDVENVFRQANGAAVVIEMQGSDESHGDYASSYEAVVEYFAHLIEKYHHNTLIFLIENTKDPGFSNKMVSSVDDVIDIMEIKEGRGNREEAVVYLKRLIADSNYADLLDDSLDKYLPVHKKTYMSNEIHTSFNRWSREILREKAYSSYGKCKKFHREEDQTKGKAYKELQAMIGLSEVKGVIDQIISSYKLQKIKQGMGFKDMVISKHMVFTGNPGSAKTTVARLLADILENEGVLDSGSLVECGRADLIGKYIGWTDKIVREKFKKARGGILFIDEAYSLVEDKGYGDEAINTIVQEMENHRDDVIVVFAGYPDKMRDFINVNEGLRSRIAFHLNFPDYDADELLKIMHLMLKKQGLSIDAATEDKCLDIFENVCGEKDFGNGRFVRSLIEHAILKQSERLIVPGRKEKPSRRKVSRLISSDFDIDISQMVTRENKKRIGFAV